ncbi:hypothetical protein OIC43_42760 [Streptomyces sp. NBC_00825]|uniref:hypothetical protein n=1 Tax=unclassified Streptomyces TaxID=2593676 RepID=UPI00224F6874|nr:MULTISPECIES: hypothetical protein [unclassified Streptomyces]WTB51860.1 hypothetical protein OG832_00920 [Streptomyces sp. NBC_00826]WTH95248.1 hypothetical protein OIC43_42760 [Streptomyces sp. NBC_00825]WTI03982.1 hypothetical protein OHA23_42735 [Streptomyces sp. NBC_00822]MCX4869573.1 hypothetical protein [Streptomyces sp. NBC_00906]MCX4900812.1 hypothetical protein [Streptomyces sp. NBC_00892]
MKRSDRIRLDMRSSAGQTAIEYLALLGIVAVVVGAIAAATIGGDISRVAHDQVCRIGAAAAAASMTTMSSGVIIGRRVPTTAP